MKMQSRQSAHRTCLALTSVGLLLLTACSNKTARLPAGYQASGAISGLINTDSIIQKTAPVGAVRNAALLGVYVSQYLTQAITIPVESAMLGIRAQQAIAAPETIQTNPDFELLQAFQDSLQVNVTDLLNRSMNRQQALDNYIAALTSVAKQADDRYKILIQASDNLQTTLRDKQRTADGLHRDLENAVNDKNFSLAGEKQTAVTAADNAVSDTEAKLKETNGLISSFDSLLSAYGQRILAMQKNRELLISGLRAVDIPGVQDLNVIVQDKSLPTNTYTPARHNGAAFDNLFDFSNSLQGL